MQAIPLLSTDKLNWADSASINASCHGILWVINLKEAISMRATGIVRRIDELGRVVIPKEIRRTLRIREGDPSLTALTSLTRFFSSMAQLSQRRGWREA